jgi:hypothetical protein
MMHVLLSYWPDGQISEIVPKNSTIAGSGGNVLIDTSGKQALGWIRDPSGLRTGGRLTNEGSGVRT